MKQQNFIEANQFLGEPENWDHDKDGPCYVLPVYNTGSRCISVWKPTKEELQTLINDGVIVLTVAGNRQPAISLDVQIKTDATDYENVTCHYCNGSGYFYSEPELGYCVCKTGHEMETRHAQGDNMAHEAEEQQKKGEAE